MDEEAHPTADPSRHKERVGLDARGVEHRQRDRWAEVASHRVREGLKKILAGK